MKKKIAALVAILLAGAGFYFAYHNNQTGQPQSTPATGITTLAELWADEEFGQTNEPRQETTKKKLFSFLFPTKTTKTATTRPTTTTAAAATVKTPEAVYVYAGVYEGIAPQVAEIPADPYLLCVTSEKALPKGYSSGVKLATCIPGGEHQMESIAAAQYRKMYTDGKTAGVVLSPFSAYRTTQRQKNNFENKIETEQKTGKSRKEAVAAASQSILPPGCSEHEAGLAIDIVSTNASFEQTEEFKWLMENAQDYGFILRYPKDKVSITLVKYEPWHWRYVGVENAQKIKASGKCLEEYLGLA